MKKGFFSNCVEVFDRPADKIMTGPELGRNGYI